LHVLAKGFDTGDILTQTKVPIEPGDTVYTLNKRTSSVGGGMLADFIEGVDLKNIRPTPQPPGNWRNYSYPSRAEVRMFRRKGGRF
jgi:methionyl-tRNA formyltransferase